MSCDMPKIAKLGDACCGCGACAARCPKGCVEMVPDAAGFLRPEVDTGACIGCGGCDSVCPAIGGRPEDAASSVCWAKSRDRDERLASSSGGIFALLAHEVLRDGGVVVGAAWAPGFKAVRHVLVEEEGRLDEVMRSKYVQSSVGREVYEGVRGSLRDGRRVLFAGTACQVAGMRAYLGRLADPEGFLAVDVICHGAPSPLLWERWAEHKERVAHTALRAGAGQLRVRQRLVHEGLSRQRLPQALVLCLPGEALVRVGHHAGRLLGHPVGAPRGRYRGRRVRRHLQHAEGRGRVRGYKPVRRERRVLPREGPTRKPEPGFARRPLR